MNFLNDYKDFIGNFTFKKCPFENIPFHVTSNGCCLGVINDIQYHIFKKIPYTIDSDSRPITLLFQEWPVTYHIAPYCKEPNYIRLMTQLNPNSEYMTSLLVNNKSVMSFLQRHMSKYLTEILPLLNNYNPPVFTNEPITHNAIQNNVDSEILDDMVMRQNTTGHQQLRAQINNNNDDAINHTPFMIYLNSLRIEKLVHLHPLCIFDTAILNLQEKILCFLKPTQITHSFEDFLIFFRSILFEMIYEYSKSDDCKTAFLQNPRKLKVKTLCHAEFFTTKRHIPPEFKCVASTPSACPHINDNIQENGKVIIRPTKTLCHFLIEKYLQDYPDDHQINTILGFKCRFQDQNLSDDKNLAKEKIFAFYNIFSKTNNIHRMCIPDQYLTVDWFKWVISNMHI